MSILDDEPDLPPVDSARRVDLLETQPSAVYGVGAKQARGAGEVVLAPDHDLGVGDASGRDPGRIVGAVAVAVPAAAGRHQRQRNKDRH